MDYFPILPAADRRKLEAINAGTGSNRPLMAGRGRRPERAVYPSCGL
jgi:hypothetical protein